MSDDVSARLALPLLSAGQAQKEISVNEAFHRIDALVQPVARSAGLSAPPASPALGDCWIVGAGATDAWAGKTGAIAQWTAGGWRFSMPGEGWRCMVVDRGAALSFRSGFWQDEVVREDGIYVAGTKVIGARQDDIDAPSGGTIVDDQARETINNLLTVLRAHGLIGP